MNFKNALKEIITNRKSDKEIEDSFFLYSRLSDLCASSYEEAKKVSLFYEIDKQVGLVSALLENNMTIYDEYHQVSGITSEKNYKSLVDTVRLILDGKSISTNNTQGNATQAPTPAPKKKVAVKASAPPKKTPNARKNNGANNVAFTPLNTKIVDTDFIIGVVAISVVAFVIVALGLLIILAAVFSWPWIFWQWLIGIVVGAVIVGTLGFLTYALNEEIVVDFYSFGAFELGVFIIINAILLVIFKESYQVIFGCFSVYSIISGVLLATFTYDELENEWMCAQIIETAISLIAMILGLALI